MSLQPRGNLKSSGEEWIGEVPNDWDVCAVSYRYEVALGKMLDEKRITGDALAPYLRNVDVQWGRINVADLPTMDFAGADLVRFALLPGDLLVCEGGEVGRSAIWDAQIVPCFYQKALHRLRPHQQSRDNPKYMQYALWAAVETGVFAASEGRSTIAHLPAEALRRYRFPFPPLAEQTAIAAFLDRETGKIDALVEEQRQLIDLLKEKRQAVISQAVTKGLDPKAKLQPSGVEWLGDVPEHWEVRRLGSLFREVADPGNEGLPILSVSIHDGVSDTELDDDDLDRKVSRSDDRSKYKKVQPADLVYNMMRAWQGGFGSVQVEGMVSPAYVVARPTAQFVTEFIEALLRTPQAVEEMRRRSRGITDFRLRLYWDEFKDLSVALPTADEQHEIMAEVFAQDARSQALIAECGSSVELLQERRSALVSAAVTGKIDVRNVERPEGKAA